MTTYEELLHDNKWRIKRRLILKRDSFQCQECLNKEIKAISKEALYIKNLKVYQTIEFGDEVIIFNKHSILIRDTADHTEYHSNVIIQNELLSEQRSSQYVVFYSIEKNEKGADIVTINCIEDILKSESEKYIYVRGLHVHHNYYQDERLPWEYPDTALKTLCWMCHEKLHSNRQVIWLDKNGNKKAYLTPCIRCHGAGYFPQYNHVENGICFKCRGAKYVEL